MIEKKDGGLKCIYKMPKKWRVSVGGPEKKTYFVEVNSPRLKKTKDGVSEPPPNFPPVDLGRTFDLDHPPILTYTQGVAQALEREEK